MSRLVARIMLALLMFPLGALVYLLVCAAAFEMRRPGESVAFLIAGLLTWTFVAVYWIWLWRRTVRWTIARRVHTVWSFPAVVPVALVAGAASTPVDLSFGVFVGGLVAILLWLFATVLLWSETGAERAARVRGQGRDTIVCPACGYNMTGLTQSVCPECGARYTIEDLVALQPSRADGELES